MSLENRDADYVVTECKKIVEKVDSTDQMKIQALHLILDQRRLIDTGDK